MVERLLFRLDAPLAAWGEIAVGEIRSSWPEPSKSAVLGLVAAALGIERQEAERHRDLHAGLSFAVRALEGVGPGARPVRARPLRDFHTAEFPSETALKGLSQGATRSEHLEAVKQYNRRGTGKINPVLSERWYWQSFVATVALTPRSHVAPRLDAIADALRLPAFPLYLGRKSCPPGRPLAPRIVDADDLVAAFRIYDDEDAQSWKAAGGNERLGGSVIWRDAEHGETPRRVRRDEVRDRCNWTFDDRGEAVVEINPSAEGA
jgi:CRISPR system Cascade subunit CasD